MGGCLFTYHSVSAIFKSSYNTEESAMTVWKDILGYEGLYQVSDEGTVKALARLVTNKIGRLQRYPERVLKTDKSVMSNSTYHRVTLCKNHVTSRFLVHRLVAEAFIPNPLNKPMINHIDNDAENNQVSNLEWVTHSENMIHAQKQGRLFHAQSKAGKIAGAISTANLHKLAQDSVGLLFNSWQVIDPDLSYRAGKAYILCKCVCGKQAQIDFARLRRLDATSCKSCAKK